MSPEGRIAIITGASSGIGRATALELARLGASLILAARREAELSAVAQLCTGLGARAIAVVSDVTRPEDCERLARTALEMFGRIDILVNCAGFALLDRVEQANIDDFESMMQTNFFGTVRCTKAVLPMMIQARNGTIVNIGSITGIMGVAGMAGYGSTKAAVIGFTESLRNEMLDHGIAVSLVCPGTTDTEYFLHAEEEKIPRASRLIPAMPAEQVASAIVRAIRTEPYRIILPLPARAYIRLKELFPRTAHALMRGVSSLIERRTRR